MSREEKASEKSLTAKQERFVAEYLVDLNATQAAIRAGYSKKTARQAGTENLSKPVIAAAVEKAIAARSTRTEITQDRVLEELARIAFFDPRKLYGPGGNPIPLPDLDADVAAVIAGLDIVVERTGAEQGEYAEVRKYKIADKLGALQAAMRHLGMFRDKVEVTGKDGGAIKHENVSPDLTNLTNEQLQQLEQLAIAARSRSDQG